MKIAEENERKIVLLGSSLLKMIKVINKASLWKIDGSVFLKASAISKTPNNKLIIFCTGSQGEEKAVLSRLAHQNYPDWKVEPGDSIILTSSPIMDNKLNIEMISNKLFEIGAKIYENGGRNLLHASGHACQEDLRLMLRLVNPIYFMPFHGDFRMLKKHGHLAKEMGVLEKNIFVCQNGEVIEAQGKDFFLSKSKISAQPSYIFNKKLLPVKELESSIATRKKMAQGGLILVLIFYDKKKEQLIESPYIFTYGFINMKKYGDLIDDWKNKISEQVKNKAKNLNLEEELKIYVENELLINWKKEKPLIHALIWDK